MKIAEVIKCLEDLAPVSLQEGYDNAGLIIGSANDDCEGIITTLDVTEEVIAEAVSKKCNLIVAHHPIIFKGLKKLNGKNYVERSVIAAIKNNIGIYAIHTNLDNVINGVNYTIAQKLNLQNVEVLSPKENTLKKLVTFSPNANAEEIRNALFTAGAGTIGKYSECSYNIEGMGTFKAGDEAEPYVGDIGRRHSENETRIEVIFPSYLQEQIIQSLKKSHPYEEVAFDIYPLSNHRNDVGSGLVGNFKEPVSGQDLLSLLKTRFGLSVVRHTTLPGKKITKVAVCGGAGSFLIPAAKAAGVDVYITSDVKYHEFFDADSTILLADIGHYESEQFTIDLLADIIRQKFPNFAVLKTETKTNPVHYFF
ncbi:Nif3-like dinuclear metal center hexameric protein [Ginsengibacter hankyongi]|uniref:GTP cyclohydrolase 1 type 2 homolog n=1 Tax=Ginsengibacter hankyongi TaxID=2607284 RepID=A0A5J5IHQ2_9BACT|nr:Nif3-like dinuclear metal center hexameric protein [Ginsengibacter hankyongi]KAA9039203.1 Nif3-like dinuclear metal center hexameric protein [Ginsengibacter hankyongi]